MRTKGYNVLLSFVLKGTGKIYNENKGIQCPIELCVKLIKHYFVQPTIINDHKEVHHSTSPLFLSVFCLLRASSCSWCIFSSISFMMDL